MKNHSMFVLFLLFGLCVITTLGVSLAANEHNTAGEQEGVSTLTSSGSDGENEENEEEETISFQDVPDPVKATILAEILREVDELTLLKVEREKEDGKTVYEAEFQYKDREIELEIAPDGIFLEKEVELIEDKKDKEKDD